MCLSNEQERLRRLILKSARDTDNQIPNKHVLKKRKRTEALYLQSVSNLLYVFPRTSLGNDSSESSWEIEQIEYKEETCFYDLSSQNFKDKNYQTHSLIHARCASTGENMAFKTDSSRKEFVLSQRKMKQDSGNKDHNKKYKGKKQQSNCKQQYSSKQEKMGNRKKVQEVNLSNYNSRKGDKTMLNSSKKLIVAEQYSLASQQGRTKKVSNAITLTCRRKIPTRDRLVTQH